ncbi:MAG: hypothetical protein ACREAU_07250, partial [Nitrosopumilaceae archaeon]
PNMDYLKNLQQIKTASDLSYALQVKMLAELERPGWYGEAIEATSSMMGGPLSNVIDYIQGNTEWQKQGQVEQLKFQNKQHEEAIKELQNPGWITKLVASEEEQNRQLTEKQKQMADNQAKINELLGIVTQQLEKANTEGENRTKVNQQAAKTAAAHLEETKKGNVACEEAAKNAAEAAKVGVKYGGQPRNCAAVGG